MKKRMYNADAVKGFAMLLVVAGHMNYAIIGNTLFSVIYSFHMPLFFLMTGYLFNDKITIGFGTFVKKKAKGLLMPYLTFLTLSFFYGYVLRPLIVGQERPIVEIKEIFEAVFLSGGHLTEVFIYNFPLWFLPLLFIAELIFYWIIRVKNKKIIIAIGVIIFLSVEVIQAQILGRPPYHINVLPVALTFMVIGWLIKDKLNKVRLGNITTMILMLLAMYIGSYNMGAHVAKVNDVFGYALVAMLWIVVIFSMMNRVKKPNFLTYIGNNTLDILGIHMLIVNCYYLVSLDNNFDKYNGIVKFLVDYLLVMLIILVIIEVKRKIKSKRGNVN